eukprot:TRINITY_DN409_c0_g1_i1.p1 TRINITY_DN409_c0_g1~~TRINITY_DN409_c0_g1_i1.p1  ORF type:complete len:828 (-),score=268.43 TRINITY_DN409_c0_g1_i1:66-2549(-)
MALNVIRIKHLHYIHVLDSNSNVTRVEIGPQTFTRQEHEKVVLGPEEMLKIPPRHYVVISNPVVRNEKGFPVTDDSGNVKLRFGDEEIRFDKDPFPLYPGESVVGKVTPLQVVAPNTALRLKALRDFKDGEVERKAGDEWLFPGPATYIPRVEVQVTEIQRATVFKENQALKLRARRGHVDRSGTPRKAGEEWLVRETGAYLPGVDEEIVETVRATVLTDKKALHLRAIKTFTDVYKKERKAGEEWLVTISLAETHIPDVYEEVVGEVKITTLNGRQYAVILDPIDAHGKPQFGKRELRRGEVSFFLQPGERLENGIQNVHILGEEEALLLRAKEVYNEKGKRRLPGERWMIHGPCDYVPPVEVEILEKRKKIPLDENEGIYVRDMKTGKVRVVRGSSYMLEPHEELWEKELPKSVEELLSKAGQERTQGSTAAAPRDKSRVVTYRAPHNSAVQIYDYNKKKSRVVFGPELVMLDPDEHFTVLSLSGNRPKKPNVLKSLALLLGPDFMTDVVTVETSDHARLALQLAYNWFFDVDKTKEPGKIFSVPDFVGDACKAIASRVRGAVASSTFDDFHKHSADIIRTAVFGKSTDDGKLELRFSANSLVITNVDIQSVEPVDQRTRDSLQKSVQLAIEITTKSQEANARHEAERIEQEAKGKLERQKIQDEAQAEKTKKELLQLQAQSAAVESTGQATAEAQARAEAALIEGEGAVKQAQLRAEAMRIRSEAELAQLKLRQEAEIHHKKAVTELELQKAKELAAIEAAKFSEVVDCVGAETIKSIAEAGPEMQAKLLQGLGLKSFLITDGNSPINLFNTAQGLIGGGLPNA